VDQVPNLNAHILEPHRRVAGLLQSPIFRGIKCCRTHENPSAAQMNKHKYIGINPSAPRQNRLGEKIRRNQRVHVRVDKLFPLTRRTTASFVGNRVMILPFKDIADGRHFNTNAQLQQFALNLFISPRKVLNGNSHDQIDSRLRRSRPTGLLRFGAFFSSQPSTVSIWFNH